jgi:hypothetical protein
VGLSTAVSASLALTPMALTWTHLTEVAAALDVDSCRLFGGRFHFVLADRSASVAVSHEIGGRLRVDTFSGAQRVSTTGWVFDSDYDRLGRLVRDAARELELEVGTHG